MVSNLALVVHAARLLEVPGTTIQACLEGWKPFAHRGEIYRQGKRLYYADCYNANPASMVDSARRFQNLFAGRRQFYVIGSMDELGEQAAQWHRRTASELAIPRDAEVFCVGPGRDWLREGLLEAGHAPERIDLGETADPVLPVLEAFEGAVFLKGSRSQRLENLIPGGAESC
jgi:UDP-N-acetylmuramoyl-tripeptide--D-alanyl-D-alanine ligase